MNAYIYTYVHTCIHMYMQEYTTFVLKQETDAKMYHENVSAFLLQKYELILPTKYKVNSYFKKKCRKPSNNLLT